MNRKIDQSGMVNLMKLTTFSIFRASAVLYFAFTCCAASHVSAKESSLAKPLTLNYLLDVASVSYPALLASRLEARASDEDVLATERIRWPTISMTVESFTGNVRSYPSRALQVDQPVWNAGRHTARISEAQVLADIGLNKVYLQQQDLFLQIVVAWQNMISSNERIKVAKLTLSRLEVYQEQMRRRVMAEASPRIDLELVEARLLQTEVELATAKTNLQVAVARLAQFTGEEHLGARISQAVYPSALLDTQAFGKQLNQIDWFTIASEHPASVKARLEVLQIKHRLDVKKAEGFPEVYVRLYKPIGTIPSSTDTNTTAFLGMRYTPGAGFASFAEAKAIGTRIASSEQSVEAVTREMQQALQSDREEFVNARTRIAALQKSVSSSALVLESYQRQFQAGRKQWQDLLNQVRDLAQNQYALADAQASMVGSMYRLQIRMGQDPK